MPKFNVIVVHETVRETAVIQLRGFSDQLRKDAPVEVSDVQEEWDDAGNLTFSFKALGFKIDGSVVTCETNVTVKGNLPFAALPFRGAIETQIAEKVREAISN